MANEQSKEVNKIKLSKEQQLKMLEFFLHTSIPRMLRQSKEHDWLWKMPVYIFVYQLKGKL